MTIRVAINGFGRIGRLVLRAIFEGQHKDMDVVAINDLAAPDISHHLFAFDSVHGPFKKSHHYHDGFLEIEGHKIKMLSERVPGNLPWAKEKIDIVFECSGVFVKHADAMGHIKAGAKKVLISAPSPDADKTVVYGVNHNTITPQDIIVSNASCTTNCLAPVAAVLNKEIGIEKGFMTTIHAYTGDQNLVDTAHKDPRRARAGALSMIPTTTGAARAVGLVLPELSGKIDGTAVRVPTANVSLVDFTFLGHKKISVDAINACMTHAAETSLKGVLGINTLPLVSSDFNHCPDSSIFDATQTQVVQDNFYRVLAWYDNEWGFSNRMLDVARTMYSF